MSEQPCFHMALMAPRFEAQAFRLADQAATFARANTPKPGARAGFWSPYEGGRPFAAVGSVAVIGVRGLLLQSFPWVGYDFATGYDGLRWQASAAFGDDQIKGIALDVNSGGGDVAGCFDFVDWLAETKAAAGKPVVAILSENAYSAAYAIASAADSISVPRTGGAGSIGAMMVHWNYAAAMGGIIPTVLRAGAHKADGHPFAPLPDEVAAEWTAELEDIRRLFAETVSRGRTAAGVDLTVEAALATEARCYTAARAVELGLADAIARPDHAMQALVSHLSTSQE